MPTFRYQAQTKDGKMVNSTIDAMNLNVAIDTLTASKLKIIEIKPVKANPFAFLKNLKKVQRDAVVLMTRRLGVMMKSGLTLARAMHVLYDQEDDQKLRPILMTVLHDVRTGSTMSWSMAKHPDVFDSIYISMVKVGETTGDMAGMLERLADFLEADLRMRKQASSAMTYPAFIFAVCLLVVGVIFVYVLPQMLAVFADQPGTKLPVPTQIMIFICDAIRNPYVQLGSLLGGVYYGIYIRDYLRTPEGKFNFDRLKIRLPIIGNLNRKIIVAHFCRAMGILLGTGIPLMKGLEVLMEFMDNEYFKQLSCQPLYEGVREGKNISQVITEVGFFPMMTCNMIAVGESTGELPQMLTKISKFYDSEVAYALEAFLVLLEPLMIGFLGLVVAFVLLSVFLPLYQFIMNIG
ncbi:MAG: type II secretion system F family protein [Armatimonadetes bacterium]|nr:type II secretion system F family protein [Armatimonadota bacterium]